MNDLFDALRAITRAAISLLAAIGVAMVVAFVVFVLFAPNARAATVINCTPKTKQTPDVVSGSKLRSAKSDSGRWFAYWCGEPDPAKPGRWIWRVQRYAVLNAYSGPIEAAIALNAGDVESFAVLNEIIRLREVVPPAGSQAEYEHRMLLWSACKALATKPYDPPGLDDLPADFCKDAPIPPPINTADWRAIGSSIFLFNGGKLTNVTSRKANAGAPCDGSTKIIVGTTIYQSLVGGPAGEVTGCRKQ